MHTFRPRGVCSKLIEVELDGDLKAIAKLVAGQRVDDVVALLRGNTCGPRATSCADQMTYALEEARAQS